MKMGISFVVVLGMGMASSVFAGDRDASQRLEKPVSVNAEIEPMASSIVRDEAFEAESERTEARGPSINTLTVQLQDLIQNELEAVTETESASFDSFIKVEREITEHFESMIALAQDGFFSASETTDSSTSLNKTLDIVSVVPTTGGVLAVINSGDGAVHVFAIAKGLENPVLVDNIGFALHVSITEQGVEVMSIDEDRLADFVGMRTENIEPVVDDAFVNGDARKLDNENFIEQLVTLSESNIEGVKIESLQKTAPGVHEFLQAMIVPMEDGTLSPRNLSQLVDSSSEQKSLNVIPMVGGVLSVLDSGTGVVNLIITAIDHESLNLDEGGFALDLAINQDGVEIMQMDDSLLSDFLGSGSTKS